MAAYRIAAAVTATALLLSGCATTTNVSRSVPAAAALAAFDPVSGAKLGTVLEGRRSRGALAAQAGIRPVQGMAGAYMDRQERDLRTRTAGSGIEVIRRGDNLDLRMASGITFDFNASTVKAQFRRTLDDVAQTLASYPSSFVDVSGFTDAVGTDAVNQRLSDERAAAVADYLGRLGVNRARIATRGYGKAMPVASNADDAGRAQNRRVEIHISPVVADDMRGGRY